MSDVKQLLAEATPLPWRLSGRDVHWERDPSISERSGLGYEIDGPPEASLRGQFEKYADAALIVAAVNRLPDYEAAVDALERVVNAKYTDELSDAISGCHAALDRLRESVPA